MSDRFERVFGSKPKVTSFTPGRVNLIGEYTDLVGGAVLPMPLAKGVTVGMARSDGATKVYSALRDETATLDLTMAARDHWSDYITAPLVVLKASGIDVPPLNLSIEATLPAGAGVSSSAALEVGVIRAVLELVGERLSVQEIARLAQRAENEFCGVQCGIMDQMAVSAGSVGSALALDCETLVSRPVPVPEGWLFAVIHSGQERQLADGAYNERRAAVKAAEAELGRSLKNETLANVEMLEDPLVRRRARHIVGEQARVAKAVQAMEMGDRTGFGQLMNESHQSLAEDFAVSTPALNALVDAARSAGADGARLTGAGFGGCIVALLNAGTAESWWAAISEKCPQAWAVQL